MIEYPVAVLAPSSGRTEPTHSIVIPVYGNEDSLPRLLARLDALGPAIEGPLEVVFVVDGSPDRSGEMLAGLLPKQAFSSRLVFHSRNFGSFAAIRTGLERASGDVIGVMAADLQEPPELMVEFFAAMRESHCDLVVGVRKGRTGDPKLSAFGSKVFWACYRRLVQREMPVGGVDVFACSSTFRDHLVRLDEAHSSLVSLTIWLGFQRESIEYERLAREDGRSMWTLRKKLKYLSDSVFSFTDLPVRMLLAGGVFGVMASLVLAVVVLVARASGAIDVAGYAATTLLIAFFGALNLAGLGIIGSYVWRAFENTKGRPGAVVMADRSFDRKNRP